MTGERKIANGINEKDRYLKRRNGRRNKIGIFYGVKISTKTRVYFGLIKTKMSTEICSETPKFLVTLRN